LQGVEIEKGQGVGAELLAQRLWKWPSLDRVFLGTRSKLSSIKSTNKLDPSRMAQPFY